MTQGSVHLCRGRIIEWIIAAEWTANGCKWSREPSPLVNCAEIGLGYFVRAINGLALHGVCMINFSLFSTASSFPVKKKRESRANQNRAWRPRRVRLAIWLVGARWSGGGGGDRPCPFIVASVRRVKDSKQAWDASTGQCDPDRLHSTGHSEVHGPTPVVKWWILCRGRRPKTENCSVKKRRRRPRKRRRSPKTWPRRKDTNLSPVPSRSASSLWFPRRPPVGVRSPPPSSPWCCRSPWQRRAARNSLRGLFTRRGSRPRRAHREFPAVPARKAHRFVTKIRALGFRQPPSPRRLVSLSLNWGILCRSNSSSLTITTAKRSKSVR